MVSCNLHSIGNNWYFQEMKGIWPSTPSKYIEWDEKYESDVSIFVDGLEENLDDWDNRKSEKNILVLVEPKLMVGGQNKQKDYELIKRKQIRDKFDMIFTTYPEYTDLEEKVKYYNGGLRTLIQESHRKVYQDKDSKIAGVFSWKCQLPGHIFRKKLTTLVQLYDKQFLLGDKIVFSNPPIQDKHEALKDCMYEIVIENESSPFFSEKLIDSMLCGCVPIYWSENEVDDSCLDIFDKKGIIIFRSLEEFKKLFNSGYFSREYYESVKNSVKNNFEVAKQYISFGDVIWNAGLKKLWS